MDTYYACILTEDELMTKAETNKKISSSLDNLSLLNDEEFTSLYSFFMYEGCATNFPWRFTGSCYLILLHEKDPIRFRTLFLDAFNKIYRSLDDPEFCDDYYDIGGLLVVCDFDVYKQFLKIALNSQDKEIKQDAQECLNDTIDDYRKKDGINIF